MPEEKLFPLSLLEKMIIWKNLTQEEHQILDDLDIHTEQDLKAAIQKTLNAQE
tara:strand:+ start:36 stop:194 length:159 start_codon:yes stop_codon:yes gene_type:complete